VETISYSNISENIQQNKNRPRVPLMAPGEVGTVPNFMEKNQHSKILRPFPFKGTGTRDLIWLKKVSLDRSWLVWLTDDH